MCHLLQLTFSLVLVEVATLRFDFDLVFLLFLSLLGV